MLIAFFAKAQDSLQVATQASVEKNLYGVQLGLINVSFQHETRLLRKVALHSEIGAELFFSTIYYYDPSIEDKKIAVFIPYISLEPRWYYGIDRRIRKEKNIKNNSSNYFSLKTSYLSGKTPLNKLDYKFQNAFVVTPKFGIRRSFAKHFNYEFSFGVGYQYNFFDKNSCRNCTQDVTALDIQTKIGYNF